MSGTQTPGTQPGFQTAYSQLHLTHRAAYLRGVQYGQADARADRGYRPRDGATGPQADQQAYGLGYMDGFADEWAS